MTSRSSDDPPAGEPDEPWPDEPDEIDPESLGPKVDIPRPPDPTASGSTADPEVKAAFWKLVLTFNIALFALSLGPMLAYFRSQLQLGGAVFALGAVTFAYGVVTYRRVRPQQSDDQSD